MSWEDDVREWSRPPIDDVGYFPSKDVVNLPEDQFRKLIEDMKKVRYTGWRNQDNKWRDVMGLDSIRGQDVMDFGCGVGVDASELAVNGNRVQLVDLSRDNINLASRTLGLYGCEPEATFVTTNEWPFIQARKNSIDVFYCNGVLHHIPWARQIVERAHELLREGGEMRLMLYSDRGWRHYIHTNPPAHTPSDCNFWNFVRIFDQVGNYADWYSEQKLNEWYGDLFTVERFEYLTDNDRYLAAVLRKR